MENRENRRQTWRTGNDEGKRMRARENRRLPVSKGSGRDNSEELGRAEREGDSRNKEGLSDCPKAAGEQQERNTQHLSANEVTLS
jgi:hypothetical protein